MRKNRLVLLLALLLCLLAGGAAIWRGTEPEDRRPATETWTRAEQTQLDDRLWWGSEFAHRWRFASELAVEIRAGDVSPLVAGQVLSAREGIDPPIRVLLARFGGRVVLHRGRVTDLEECRDLRGRRARLYYVDDVTYDDATGLYRALGKAAYVQVAIDLARAERTLLHELGHMLDDALGMPSQEDAFGAALALDDATGHLGRVEDIDYPARRRGEYFAQTFAAHFGGARSRAWLRHSQVGAAQFWEELVARESEARHRELTAEIDALLAERVAARGRRD